MEDKAITNALSAFKLSLQARSAPAICLSLRKEQRRFPALLEQAAQFHKKRLLRFNRNDTVTRLVGNIKEDRNG